jgi:hypothetical protein
MSSWRLLGSGLGNGPRPHTLFVFRLCAEPKVTTPAVLPLGEEAGKGDAAPEAAAQPRRARRPGSTIPRPGAFSPAGTTGRGCIA